MGIKDTSANYKLLEKVLEKNTISELSELLYVNKNTIQRWILLKSVPWQYHVDLKKLLCLEIDYDEYSYIEKDQFFTSEKISLHC